MKIKTRELVGKPLDWAVAKAANRMPQIWDYSGFYEIGVDGTYPGSNFWEPSIDWEQGGPLIDKHKPAMTPIMGCEGWCAEYDIPTGMGDADTYEVNGPTFLISAMRAIVATKLGDEVEVPDELAAPAAS